MSGINVFADENAGKFVFRYKFQKDDELKWEVTNQVNQLTTTRSASDNIETRSISTKIWKVREVDSNGTAILEYSLGDVDMKSYSSLRKEESRFNSKSDEKPAAEYLGVAEMIGVPIAHLTINIRGDVINRSQIAKITASTQFGETTEENRITIPFPDDAIGVGDTWVHPREIVIPKPNGTVKKVAVRERYTLEKIQHGIATFDFKTIVITPLYDDKETDWELRNKVRTEGTIQFDIEKGQAIFQQYGMKKSILNALQDGKTSATYQSRFTEKIIRDEPESE